MTDKLTCPVCGYQFESGPEGACGPCPLHSDCAMACCPACGHSTINPHKSSWVQRLERWFSPRRQSAATAANEPLKVHVPEEQIDVLMDESRPLSKSPDTVSLDDIPPGNKIRVAEFSAGLSLQHQLRLQAFGVEPGHQLEVVQQHPVTIVKVDHMELAVERLLAREIFVLV